MSSCIEMSRAIGRNRRRQRNLLTHQSRCTAAVSRTPVRSAARRALAAQGLQTTIKARLHERHEIIDGTPGHSVWADACGCLHCSRRRGQRTPEKPHTRVSSELKPRRTAFMSDSWTGPLTLLRLSVVSCPNRRKHRNAGRPIGAVPVRTRSEGAPASSISTELSISPAACVCNTTCISKQSAAALAASSTG